MELPFAEVQSQESGDWIFTPPHAARHRHTRVETPSLTSRPRAFLRKTRESRSGPTYKSAHSSSASGSLGQRSQTSASAPSTSRCAATSVTRSATT
jgi:hypothetical protein